MHTVFKKNYTTDDNNLKIIFASNDELDDILIFPIKVFQEDINIEEAVINACIEFYYTTEGEKSVKREDGWWNWQDFYNKVPNEICEKHGFRKINSEILPFSYDQQLIPEYIIK